MNRIVRPLVLAFAAASLAGCADAAGILAAAASASAAPGAAVPGAAASAAPAATTPAGGSTTPVNTAASTKPAAAATEAPVQAMDPSECKATKSDDDKDNGTPAMGDYNNQWLPKGWADAYKSEAAVTAAIDKIKDADWACFQKFYPGATTVYGRKKNLT